jgi:hypothetical protein
VAQSDGYKLGFLRRVSPIQWFALALVCLVGALEFLNFTDFCYSERRYLGDEGLIDATIRYELEQASRKGFNKYTSVAQFHEVNPKCCTMMKWGDPVVRTGSRGFAIWMRRILGDYFIVVDLKYRIKDEGSEQFDSAHYLINSCGRPRSVVSRWGSLGH